MVKNAKVAMAEALGQGATDKRIDILKRIGAAGSISEAARGAGVSYKAAWQAIETLSNLAGSALIEKVVGGAGGGGARLTQAGVQLLHASEILNEARNAALAKLDKERGEQAGMPGLSVLGLRTSMRNQFPCTVLNVRKKSAVIRVELALVNDVRIFSRITRESVDLLDLHRGQAVLALCKATAVSVAATLEVADGYNVLPGKVSRLTPYARGMEVSLELAPGLHVVGFAEPAHGMKLHGNAMAAVEESGMVIAVAG